MNTKYYKFFLLLPLLFFLSPLLASAQAFITAENSCHDFPQGEDYPPSVSGWTTVNSASSVTLAGGYDGGRVVCVCFTEGPYLTSYAFEVLEMEYRVLGTNIEGLIEAVFAPPAGYDGICGDVEEWHYNFEANINTSSLAPGQYTVEVYARNDNNQVSYDYPTFTIPSEPTPATIVVQSNMTTNWTITGPGNSIAGNGTYGSYQRPAGTWTISADQIGCYSRSITPSSQQTVGPGSQITFTITYTYNCGGDPGDPPPPPPPPPPAVQPSCTGGAPQASITTATSGGFYLYAYGVQNATSVVFPTWSNVNGQDEIAWYPGTYMGNNTWRATVNLASHRVGNPDYGLFNAHIYMSNASYTNVFCATANFTRNIADQAPIGVLDAANCSIIGGWAFDPDSSSSQINVHIYTDGPAGSGNFLTNTVTTGLRQDVNDAYGITGNHGFTINTPNSLKTGTNRTIYAYGINTNPAGSHTLLSNSPMTINCTIPTHALSVAVSPAGGGTVTGPGINCPGDCNESYQANTPVTLNATPSTNYSFSHWTGSCTGQSASCNITMDAAKSATAYFTALTNNASCVAHNIPSTMTTGQSVPVSLTFRNTGTKTWTFSGWTGYAIALNPYPNPYVPPFIQPTDVQGQTGTTLPGQDKTINFTLTAPSTPGSYTGNYQMIEVGQSFFGTGCGHPTITVSAPAFNYALSNTNAINVTKGAAPVAVNKVINKTLTAGVSQAVTITATGMPAGVSVSYDGNRSCSPNCSSTITFTVQPSAPTGTFPITVTGSPLNRTVVFNLNISGSASTVTCVSSPVGTAYIGQPVTWTANVSGGTPPYTYSWSFTGIPPIVPAPTTNPYTISYSTVGTKTAVATVTTADGLQTSCSPAGTIIVNFNPDFEEF